MKLILVFLSLICVSLNVNAQFVYFNNRYNNDNWSTALSIIENDTGYVVCGVSGEVNNNYIFRRIVLTAVDDYGNQLWWKIYGEDFHDYYAGNVGGCIKTDDNGYIVSGSITDSIRNVGLLIKFDQNGDSLWSRIYGDTISLNYSSTIFNVCVQLPDNGFLITGHQYISGDDADLLLIRTDNSGVIKWEKTYGSLHIIEDGYSIAQLPEGEFLIGINRQNLNINNSMDPGLLKVDSSGNLVWMKYYGGPYDDSGSSVALSQDGNYLVGSSFAIAEPQPGYPQMKVWIFKTDTSGEIIWERKYSEIVFVGGCTNIDELNDGTIIASGLGGFEDSFAYEGWIIKTKQNGDSLWMRRYSFYPEGLNHLNDLCLTSDNGIIFSGMTLGDPEWEQSIWIQKLDSIGCDSVGCDTTVGIYEGHGGVEAGGHGSLELWPNPASDLIHITFRQNNLNRFPVRDRELEIFNVYGEKVVGMKLSIFQESITQNISGLAQGLYLVVLRERQKVVSTGKFLIAR